MTIQEAVNVLWQAALFGQSKGIYSLKQSAQLSEAEDVLFPKTEQKKTAEQGEQKQEKPEEKKLEIVN